MIATRALVLLHENFEELEAVAPIDLLRRAGIDVTVASTESSLKVKGRGGIMIEAQVLLSAVEKESFDCIILPGGPGIQKLRTNKSALKIIEHQAKANKWVAAICAAPLILNDLGLLKNHPFTAHSGTLETLNVPHPKDKVIVSSPFITSKGAGTAIEFALNVIQELVGKEASKRVAEAIEYTPKAK